MEIKDLYISNELVDTFNLGFSDFIVKIPYMTKSQFIKRMIIENNTDIKYSSICIHDNRIIGFSLVGIRNNCGMINSFCVLKEYRGSNAATLLVESTLEKTNGKDVYLEVVKDNERAVNFYKKVGFIEYRNIAYVLGFFMGNISNYTGEIRFLSKEEVINYQSLLDIPLTWNNNLFCIFKQEFKALGYFEQGILYGFIIYIDGISVNIKQLYVKKENRRQGIGSRLLYEAIKNKSFSFLFIKNGIGEIFFSSISKSKYLDSYLMKHSN